MLTVSIQYLTKNGGGGDDDDDDNDDDDNNNHHLYHIYNASNKEYSQEVWNLRVSEYTSLNHKLNLT